MKKKYEDLDLYSSGIYLLSSAQPQLLTMAETKEEVEKLEKKIYEKKLLLR
ncbi:hypothetical protein [uncultured Ruminococcus sp.]|uniref:hypothetical protein n=1 Tax=uncultured Ruminococcus sp. TaxID=165186 RepID=UPI0025F161C9|nr:hypothetical protein [uncultured Ruminococcus sp.]